MSAPEPEQEQEKGWLEQPHIVDRLVYGLWALCALLLIAGLFYHGHPHFGFDGWFGFYAAYGFFAYCAIVLSAKGLRRFVRRDENYYADGAGVDDSTGEEPPDDG